METAEYLESLLTKQVRVLLTDDRSVEGTLHCVDSSSNLILHDVKVSQSQLLPIAMINGKHIVKFEVLRCVVIFGFLIAFIPLFLLNAS